MSDTTAQVTVEQCDREAAGRVFDARKRRALHPNVFGLERHHAEVIRAGEGDDYDAVQAAAVSRLSTLSALPRHPDGTPMTPGEVGERMEALVAALERARAEISYLHFRAPSQTAFPCLQQIDAALAQHRGTGDGR